MHLYNIFWIYFNWLELVTYVLIPTAMVLIILLYIVANIKLIELSFGWDYSVLEKLDSFSNEKQKLVDSKYFEENDVNLKTK